MVLNTTALKSCLEQNYLKDYYYPFNNTSDSLKHVKQNIKNNIQTTFLFNIHHKISSSCSTNAQICEVLVID